MTKQTLTLGLLLILFIVSGVSQEITIDTEYGIQPENIAKDQNGDIVITAFTNDDTWFWRSMIIKVSADLGNMASVIIDDTLNELFAPKLLIDQENHYILNTVEKLEGGGNWFDRLTFIVFDEALDMLAFKRYNMEHEGPAWNDVLMKFIQNGDGRIYGFGIRGDNNDFIAIEINGMGDTLRTKLINSFPGTTLCAGIMGSHNDSIALFTMINGFDASGIWKVLTLDTAFNYTYTDIVMETGYAPQSPMCNWLNDSIYMGVGFYPLPNADKDLVLYRANARQGHAQVGSSVWVLRPDTADSPAMNTPTYVDPNVIYVGSYRGSSPGAAYDGRYMVVVVDGQLNILGMKSLGKAGSQYEMHAMQATDDLGCIVTGTVHDYINDPSSDWDLFIRKLSPGEIVDVAENTEDPYDSDYFIYPNPGNESLHVRTARKGVVARLTGIDGKVFAEKRLGNSFDQTINVSNIPSGNYIIRFTDREGYEEKLKWIKK